MQAQAIKEYPNLRDLAGFNLTEMLSNMPIGKGKKDGYETELEKVMSVRSLISLLHKNTKLKFETAKTDNGMVVWRVK